MGRLDLKTMLFPLFVAVAIVLGLFLGLRVSSVSGPLSDYGIPVGIFFMIYPAMANIASLVLLESALRSSLIS